MLTNPMCEPTSRLRLLPGIRLVGSVVALAESGGTNSMSRPHLDQCLIDPCTCPAPWRVRHSRDPLDRWPWQLERLMGDGTYDLFVRAASFDRAMAMVDSVAGLIVRHRTAFHGR